MLKKAVKLLRGSVCARAKSAYPERMLNLCSARGIEFWDVRWIDDTALSFCVARGDLRALRRAAEGCGAEVSIERTAGTPFFFARLRRRHALIAGGDGALRKAVEHADSAVLDAFADTDEQPKAAPLSNEDMNEFDKLLETIRKVLGDQIKDARVSHRLADSPACLVSPDDGVTSSMERLMRVMHKDDSIPQKIFDINREHPLLRTMLKLS